MPNVQSPTKVAALGSVALEGGGRLDAVEAAYEQYGRLSPNGDNALLVCHALTGSARAAGEGGWWDPLIGPGAPLDTNKYAVICSNILGSCYGTTGPRSIDPATGHSYGGAFPKITIGDMVSVQRKLLDSLGVTSIVSGVGGSLGGLQILEWAAQAPEKFRSLMPIATSLAHSAWCIAFNECARQAIRSDPAYFGGDYQKHGTGGPERGLALARMIAMISYRSAPSFGSRFGRMQRPPGEESAGQFEVEAYLHYQGEKLVERFEANSYLRITEAMDAFDVGQGRGGAAAALAGFNGPALVMGIDSDVLYPLADQQEIADALRANGNEVMYREVTSPHGHDAFLMEWDQLGNAIREFLATVK